MCVLNLDWKGLTDSKEKEVKCLTSTSLPLSFLRMKIGLYHNEQVLDEGHVFDVVVLHHV